MRDLVDVHELVDEDEHPCIACLPQECGKEFQILVPVVVRDDDVHTEIVPRLGLCRILPTKPACNLRPLLIIAVPIGMIVERQKPRKVKSMHEIVQPVDDGGNAPVNSSGKIGVLGSDTVLRHDFLLYAADPTVKDERECPALGRCLRRHIADELAVRRESLPARPLQASLGREIGIHHDEILCHHIAANRLQKEALAAAVASNDKAERSPAALDHLHIGEQCLNLAAPSDGDVRKADARHNTALERIHECLGNAARDFLRFIRCHADISPLVRPDNREQRRADRPRSPCPQNHRTVFR